MNLGLFSKDIWELLFQHFEINFSPSTLNSLSLTCRKLNSIDKERRRRYIKTIEKKYNHFFDLIIFHYKYRRGRIDYISLNKYTNIGMIDISTKKLLQNDKNSKNVLVSIYPDLYVYLQKLRVNTYKELIQMSRVDICRKFECRLEDIELIHAQTDEWSFIFSAFSYIKWDGDIIDSISELQEILN